MASSEYEYYVKTVHPYSMQRLLIESSKLGWDVVSICYDDGQQISLSTAKAQVVLKRKRKRVV